MRAFQLGRYFEHSGLAAWWQDEYAAHWVWTVDMIYANLVRRGCDPKLAIVVVRYRPAPDCDVMSGQPCSAYELHCDRTWNPV